MKRIVLLLLLAPVLTACPPQKDRTEDVMKKFQENHFNLELLKKEVYGKIKFQLPESMEKDYATNYVYRRQALTRRDYNLGLAFSVERFTEGDMYSEMMEDYVVEEDLLNSFHDAYVNRRLESLYQGGLSFKKDVRSNVKFPGVIQVVTGESSRGYNALYYATATLKVEKEYYIFQMIAPKSMMDYVYDDFERILASVRKK